MAKRVESPGYLREGDIALAGEIAARFKGSVTAVEPPVIVNTNGVLRRKVIYSLPQGGISGMDISTRVDEVQGRTDRVTGRPTQVVSPASRPHNYT